MFDNPLSKEAQKADRDAAKKAANAERERHIERVDEANRGQWVIL